VTSDIRTSVPLTDSRFHQLGCRAATTMEYVRGVVQRRLTVQQTGLAAHAERFDCHFGSRRPGCSKRHFLRANRSGRSPVRRGGFASHPALPRSTRPRRRASPLGPRSRRMTAVDRVLRARSAQRIGQSVVADTLLFVYSAVRFADS
jgi:hypothetical protein